MSNMTNLLKETVSDIKVNGYEIDDIIYIGSEETGHSCTWGEFKSLADVEYHDGYGTPVVAIDLKIVFSDGSSMRRQEYDGSEWWEFIKPFTMPDTKKPITNLFGSYNTLKEIN